VTVLDSLSRRQAGLLRDAARSGRYHLLLGAGASAGAQNSRGDLPMAPGLVDILAQRFPSAPIPADTALPRAYQRAVSVSSPEAVWWVLREVFLHSNHREWYSTFATLPWKRVWTLNVDDVFENAYRRAKTQCRVA
jgi:hypothetical protein